MWRLTDWVVVCVCVCVGAGQCVRSHPSTEHTYPCQLEIARLRQDGITFALYLLPISIAVHDFQLYITTITIKCSLGSESYHVIVIPHHALWLLPLSLLSPA